MFNICYTDVIYICYACFICDTYIHICICVCVYIYVCEYVCKYACICMCVYAYRPRALAQGTVSCPKQPSGSLPAVLRRIKGPPPVAAPCYVPRALFHDVFLMASWSSILVPSWGHLGPSWGFLGLSWGHLGAIMGHLGAILGPSWGHLGPSWGHAGPSWDHLGPSWGCLGPKSVQVQKY